MLESARSLFKLIYKIGTILVTLTLGGLAVLAYLNATPANGLLLICGILAILTLIAGLSISKLDDQDRQAEAYREIGQGIRNLLKASTTIAYAEPEVHRVDAATVEDARRMASEGRRSTTFAGRSTLATTATTRRTSKRFEGSWKRWLKGDRPSCGTCSSRMMKNGNRIRGCAWWTSSLN